MFFFCPNYYLFNIINAKYLMVYFFFLCMLYIFFFIIIKNTSKEYKSLYYCVRNPLHKLHFTRYFAREYNIRLVLLK